MCPFEIAIIENSKIKLQICPGQRNKAATFLHQPSQPPTRDWNHERRPPPLPTRIWLTLNRSQSEQTQKVVSVQWTHILNPIYARAWWLARITNSHAALQVLLQRESCLHSEFFPETSIFWIGDQCKHPFGDQQIPWQPSKVRWSMSCSMLNKCWVNSGDVSIEIGWSKPGPLMNLPHQHKHALQCISLFVSGTLWANSEIVESRPLDVRPANYVST